MFLGNQTVGTKQLTFFFTFERLGDCCGLIKACCGLIKAFGEGWLRQRLGLTERTNVMEEKQAASVSERASLTLCEVRAWMWECESVRGCARERVRGCARDGCARERVRVRQYRVICKALKFEFSLFKTRVSETRFYFSKPSLRHSRSTWAETTWRVHVELEFLTLEFHVDTPRGFCPHQERKPSLRGLILGP